MDAVPLALADDSASRAEVLAHFHDDIYGRVPTTGWESAFDLLSEHRSPTGLLRQQWGLRLSTERGSHRSVVLVDRPADRRPVPAVLALNFRGNHACTADPAVLDPQEDPDGPAGSLQYAGLREPVTLPIARGVEAHRWPAELLVSRGYAAITACYLQCGPDARDSFDQGIHRLFADTTLDTRAPHEWGLISIWSWYLSRILDAVDEGMAPGIDPRRVAVAGHSRLGKTALWTAARDARFAAAISNDSGCMGAARSRPVGETPELLSQVRPHWFAPRFTETIRAGRPLPVDQHQLIAAIAPRPVHIGSASDDAPANPEGEFNSLCAAAPAWGIAPGAARPEFPAPDRTVSWAEAPLGHHLRRGDHELLTWDWIQYLAFLDRWL